MGENWSFKPTLQPWWPRLVVSKPNLWSYMPLNLRKLVIIEMLSRQTRRPWRQAMWRLAAITTFLGIIGVLLAKLANRLPFGFGLEGTSWFSLVSLASFALLSLILIPLGSILAAGQSQRPSLSVMAATWPLSRRQKWLINASPNLIICGLLVMGLTWPVISAGQLAAQPFWLSLLALF